MFGLSMMEVMVILVVALLVLGPDQLPKAAKSIGKTLRDVRKASDDLRDTFEREVMQDQKPPPIRRPEGATAPVASLPDAIIGANAPPPLEAAPPPTALAPAAEASPPVPGSVEASRTPAASSHAVPPTTPPVEPVITAPLVEAPPALSSFALGDDPFAAPPGGRRS